MKKWLAILFLIFLPILIAAFFYVDRVRILGLISIYGALSIGRILFQVLASNFVRRKKYDSPTQPYASIIVASFNEDPDIVARCLQSLVAQDYPGFEVILVDDGSDNQADIEDITKLFGVKYIYQENAGKREAMLNAFGSMSDKTKVVLTADSDTVWEPNAATELVKVLASDPKIGAVTGYVGVSNAKTNFLTRIVDQRYWMAFNQERAAQSLFGAVICVSGPLGAYRRSLIEKIKGNFATQRFLGKKCTFGDDRHLTNLVLGLGYQVKYAALSRCYSEAPTTIKTYIKQQARWGKSHWREMWWQFKALPKQSLYLSYDWAVSLLLPFLLVMSLGHYLYLAVTESPVYLGWLLLMMFSMTVLRILDPIRQTKNLWFLLFIVYTVFHLVVLLPLKFYSLFTINRTGWGTRKKEVPKGVVVPA